MRILLVGPGASFSVSDVHEGLRKGLEARGVKLVHFNLDQRIAFAASWLRRRWEKLGKPKQKPTAADTYYLAAQDILEKALRHEVDWVIVVSAMFFHPDLLVLLKRAGSCAEGHNRFGLGILFTESPYDDEKQARVAPTADVCWTNERTSVPILMKANPRTFYLGHAFDATKHKPESSDVDEADVPAHDVVFVGTAFEERVELLGSVDWGGIDLGLYGNWQMLGSRHRLRKFIRAKETDNAKTAALYRKAKIGLNLHRTSKGFGRGAPKIGYAESLNPRAYELAACGLFHLSDYRLELEEIFGDLVPTFSDGKDLGTVIRYWLDHDKQRQEAARKLPAAVAGHDWQVRADKVIGDLEQFSPSGPFDLSRQPSALVSSRVRVFSSATCQGGTREA